MDVPTHLCAHTPCTCGNAMHTGTLTTHVRTGLRRSPGSRWQGRLPAAPPWGGGGNPTGGAPSSGRSPGPHTGLAALPSPQPSVLAPRPRPRSEAGQGHLTPASLPLPPPGPSACEEPWSRTLLPTTPGATTSHPMQATCPRGSQPAQSSLRQGALGPPRVGAAGARGEVAPPRGAAGLRLCAHFGNCQFSSLANYLLGGGLKTVHTHKSPRDLNKRQWQVIFQHSPTLTHRERGRVGPRVGCGENELRRVQGPAPRHPGRLMEGQVTRAWPASQIGTGVPRAAERPHPPTPTTQSPSCGVWTCGEEASSLWVCLTTRAGVPQGSEYVCGVRPKQKGPQEAVSRAPQRASPCATRATEHLPDKHSREEREPESPPRDIPQNLSHPGRRQRGPPGLPTVPTHRHPDPCPGRDRGPADPPSPEPALGAVRSQSGPGTAPPCLSCSGRNPRHRHHGPGALCGP